MHLGRAVAAAAGVGERKARSQPSQVWNGSGCLTGLAAGTAGRLGGISASSRYASTDAGLRIASGRFLVRVSPMASGSAPRSSQAETFGASRCTSRSASSSRGS